jgi:hypothetical protein
MLKVKNDRGFLLISSYLVLSSLMVVSLSLWTRSTFFMKNIDLEAYRLQSFHLAESGIDQAIDALETNLAYTGTAGDVTYTKNILINGVTKTITLGTINVLVTTPDQQNPNRKKIVSIGNPNADATVQIKTFRKIITYVDLIPQKMFQFAVFSDEDFSLNGNTTVTVDSYNSNNGPYNALNPGNSGDVGTNSTGANMVSLIGNANVNGSVTVGKGGDPNTVIEVSPGATITGSTSASPAVITYVAPTVPTTAVNLGNLSVNGGTTMILPGGTYLMSSLSITGNGNLQFSGPATVYLTGTANIAGNGISTANNLPSNLIFNVVGNNSVAYSGNGNFYAGIYAPDASVNVSGNGQVFGAVVANTYSQDGNGKFHFDEALKDMTNPDRFDSDMVAWQEDGKMMTNTTGAAYSV